MGFNVVCGECGKLFPDYEDFYITSDGKGGCMEICTECHEKFKKINEREESQRMTKIFYGGRRSGWTSGLIKLSAITGYPIVTANRQMADSVMRRARDMGIEIPEPMHWTKARDLMTGMRVENVIVDDADLVLAAILGARVEGMSVESGVCDVLGLVGGMRRRDVWLA